MGLKNARTGYLLLYNLIMWLSFSYICASLLKRYFYQGLEGVPGAYLSVATLCKPLFIVPFLEVLHPILGITRGNPIMPMIQTGVRAFILFAMINAEPRVQDNKSVVALIFIWSMAEVIRYPYYMIGLLGIEDKALTWMRYSAWIVLYPIGILLEAVVFCQNLAFLEQSQRLSYLLPNQFNFSFYMPGFLKFYLSVGIWIGSYIMLSHMYSQRKKVLGASKATAKSGKIK